VTPDGKITEHGAGLFSTREIRPGDDVIFLGQPHRITAVEPYDGPMTQYGCFALAQGRDGWGIALYDGQALEVDR
jgi:hypothetical protein